MSDEPFLKRDIDDDVVIASFWPKIHCPPALDWLEGSCEI